MVTSPFLLGLLFIANYELVYAELREYSCKANKVLAVSSQKTTEIDMNQVQPTICGEKRICAYSTKPECVGKGEYVAGVITNHGKIMFTCCKYSPPVKDHQADSCQSLVIEAGGSVSTLSALKPPPSGHKPQPSGGNGHNNMVMMELKKTPPASDQQLVKSIKSMPPSTGDAAKGYIVTVCRPTCQRSTSTKQPTTHTPPTPPPQENNDEPPKRSLFNRGGGGPRCFSGNMMVSTPNGQKRMDRIRAGEEVLVTLTDSKPIYEPIEWLYHMNPDIEADLITLRTRSGRVLQLSHNHLIPVVPCSNDHSHKLDVVQFASNQSIFAGRLKLGDCVATLIDNEFRSDKIVSMVQERQRGIFSPITRQGTIVVNQVFASCFSSFENHLLQQSVHSALITARHALAGLWDKVFGSSLAPEDANIPLPLQMLLKIAQFVLPSTVYNGY